MVGTVRLRNEWRIHRSCVAALRDRVLAPAGCPSCDAGAVAAVRDSSSCILEDALVGFN